MKTNRVHRVDELWYQAAAGVSASTRDQASCSNPIAITCEETLPRLTGYPEQNVRFPSAYWLAPGAAAGVLRGARHEVPLLTIGGLAKADDAPGGSVSRLSGMGMYASARGWLEADHKHREAVEAVIADARRDLYSGGWAFPERPFNWTLYVFYGGDIREAELPWLRDQVERMAALPAVDDDGDMPVGLFVISDERAAVSVWEVRDGRVRDRPAPELAWVFRE